MPAVSRFPLAKSMIAHIFSRALVTNDPYFIL
jgi:hypothetical protein